MNELTLIFLAGAASSFHYSGSRCGYLRTLDNARSLTGRVAVAQQLLFNVGRIGSYMLLGALAAILGGLLVTHPHPGRVSEVVFAPRALAILAGGLLAFGSVRLHGWIPAPQTEPVSFEASLGGVVAVLVRPRSHAAPVGFGAVNGLQPCPYLYAMLALAARTGDVSQGMHMLLAFGFGTLPMVFVTTLLGERWGPALARLGAHPAAAYLMALGLLTLGSALLPVFGAGPFGGA
jgi:sulfite exporter TauE/SafE